MRVRRDEEGSNGATTSDAHTRRLEAKRRSMRLELPAGWLEELPDLDDTTNCRVQRGSCSWPGLPTD